MERIEVIRGSALKTGSSTKGIVRDVAFEGEGVIFARSRIAGGNKSGWHHHGRRGIYGFMASGRLRFDFNGGKDSVEVGPGDYFYIPVGLVHRDTNPDKTEAVVVNVLIGEGPTVVNVDG